MICLKLCRRIFVGFIALSWSANAFAAAYVGSAYEPFNYTVGSNLVIAEIFQPRKTGWNATGTSAANAATGAWGDTTALPAVGGSDAAKTITTPSLTYSVSGYPASTGNKTTIDGTSATNNVSRNIGQTVDTGTFYFSYLSKLDVATQRTFSLGFFGPANGVTGTPGNTTERVSNGQIGVSTAGAATTNGNIGLIVNNNNTATSNSIVNATTPIAYGTNVTHLIVGRVDWNPTGNDTFSLYVDPTSLTAEPVTPYIQTMGL